MQPVKESRQYFFPLQLVPLFYCFTLFHQMELGLSPEIIELLLFYLFVCFHI